MPWRCATSCAIAPNEAIRFMGVVRPAMNQRRNHQMHADGFVVELGGFEPPTLSMPWRCATSCAIAPFSIVGPLFGPRIHYDEMSILAKAGVSPNGKSGIWRHFLACFRHYSGIGLFNYRLNGFSNTLNLLAQQGAVTRSAFAFPLVGVGDGRTVIVVQQTPAHSAIGIVHRHQAHPVRITQ